MSKLVVDASVAAKWLVTEPLSDKAVELLGASDDLLAPDLFLAEVGNILWKKVRTGDLTTEMAEERFQAVQRMGVALIASTPFAGRALAIAIETGRTMYDSLYLALAETEDCRFVTADERLVRALAQSGTALRALWLGAL